MPRTSEKTILLVEDEMIIAMHEQSILEEFGYRVRTVGSGEAAVQTVREDPGIDLVLMDIDLGPGMPGDEAAEQILAIRHLPIVFLTSHAEQEFVKRVKRITRYGYVIKNSGELVLWDTIEVAFELFEAYQAAREREERYRAVFYNAHSPMLLVRPSSGEIVSANRAAVEFYGYSDEELQGKRIQDINELTDDEVQGEMERARTEERNYFVFEHRRANGEVRTVEVRSNPIVVEGEELLFSIVHDATERFRMQEELERSERRYRTLFDLAPIGIFRSTSDGKPRAVNRAMGRLLGYDNPERIVEGVQNVGGELYARPERRDELVAALSTHGEVHGFEFDAFRADGSTVRMRMNARKTNTNPDGSFEIEGFAVEAD